jgi:hypothetical protein
MSVKVLRRDSDNVYEANNNRVGKGDWKTGPGRRFGIKQKKKQKHKQKPGKNCRENTPRKGEQSWL